MLITSKSLNTLKLDCVRLSSIDNAILNCHIRSRFYIKTLEHIYVTDKAHD